MANSREVLSLKFTPFSHVPFIERDEAIDNSRIGVNLANSFAISRLGTRVLSGQIELWPVHHPTEVTQVIVHMLLDAQEIEFVRRQSAEKNSRDHVAGRRVFGELEKRQVLIQQTTEQRVSVRSPDDRRMPPEIVK